MIDGGINVGQLLAVVVSIGSLLMTFYFNNKSLKDREKSENASRIEREKKEAIVNERIISSVKGVKNELESFKCENKISMDSYRIENRQLMSDFKEEIYKKLDKNNEEFNKKLDKSNEEFNKKLDKNNEDLNKRFEDLSKELKSQQEITTKIREENVETKSSAKSAHKRLDDIVKLIGKREDI